MYRVKFGSVKAEAWPVKEKERTRKRKREDEKTDTDMAVHSEDEEEREREKGWRWTGSEYFSAVFIPPALGAEVHAAIRVPPEYPSQPATFALRSDKEISAALQEIERAVNESFPTTVKAEADVTLTLRSGQRLCVCAGSTYTYGKMVYGCIVCLTVISYATCSFC